MATISTLQRSRLGRVIRSEIESCTPLFGDSPWWPGLVIQRAPIRCPPQWQQMSGPLLAVMVQGQARIADGDRSYQCREFDYLVIDGAHTLRCEARTDPHVWMSLRIDPELLHRMAALQDEGKDDQMCTTTGAAHRDANTTTDIDVLGAVKRFVCSMSSEPDRHVLAPIYFEELTYRLTRLRHVDGAGVSLSNGFLITGSNSPLPA